MTRLTWGASGERFYETGVDRGVLYVSGQGVAWAGLISVAEDASGGGAKPFYIDGFKYLNLSSAEEFEATINAFAAPTEFSRCDGSLSMYSGLIATQQPRKPFSLSYRTKIGNDVDGGDHAYKIHVVYNALAAPSSRTHETIGETAAPGTLSWAITTVPPMVSGLRPTAHFVIDTRNTAPEHLAIVESMLYGTDQLEPILPTVQQLLDIFNDAFVYEGGISPGVGSIFDGGIL